MATVMTELPTMVCRCCCPRTCWAELERVGRLPRPAIGGSVQVQARSTTSLVSPRAHWPAAEAGEYIKRLNVVYVRRGEAQAHLLVRTNGTTEAVPPGWGPTRWPRRTDPGLYARSRRGGVAGPRAQSFSPWSEELRRSDHTHAGGPRREPSARCRGEGWPGHLAAAPAHVCRRRLGLRPGGRCTCSSLAGQCTSPTPR